MAASATYGNTAGNMAVGPTDDNTTASHTPGYAAAGPPMITLLPSTITWKADTDDNMAAADDNI